MEALRAFQPDLIHITGPGDCSLMGAIAAWHLGVPMAASWHTNVHEFLERRIHKTFAWLPPTLRSGFAAFCRETSLTITLQIYKPAQVLYAPNQELVSLLESRTGRPCHVMTRGIDTHLFDPARRRRSDDAIVLGFVGRLFAEKNVRFLKNVEDGLLQRGITNYRFLIVGHGSEEDWLRTNLRQVEIAGLLRGEALAAAYANMDIFVFPSHTDTFGNVVQEALASGVPAVVTGSGGPKFIVRDGISGLVGDTDDRFISAAVELAENTSLRDRMKQAARQQALNTSWDAVFEAVYNGYSAIPMPSR